MVRGVQVTGVVDAVAEELRGLVLGGELVAEAPVTEAGVSERFGVARPSAKAAIEKLVAEGLLLRTAHRSARVPRLDPHAVLDVYATRRRLESEAVRELARRRFAPAGAREANARIGRYAGGSSVGVVEPDMLFHSMIVDALGSERTSRAYRSLVGEVRLCMAQVQGQGLISADLIHAEHGRLLELIEEGRPDEAVALLAEHLDRAGERLAEVIRADIAVR